MADIANRQDKGGTDLENMDAQSSGVKRVNEDPEDNSGGKQVKPRMELP